MGGAYFKSKIEVVCNNQNYYCKTRRARPLLSCEEPYFCFYFFLFYSLRDKVDPLFNSKLYGQSKCYIIVRRYYFFIQVWVVFRCIEKETKNTPTLDLLNV